MSGLGLGNRKAQHSFAQIPDVRIARSKFNRSHGVKDTISFDYLTPIYVDEVIPGDTHNVLVNCFARLSTQIRPVMDNMYLDFFFFFVPNRLLWSNWERFNGAQDNPGDSTSFSVPILTTGAAFTVGSIFDKMGLPTDKANVAVKNTLPLRAYKKIWNDWFRDENLQNSLTLSTGDGPDVQGDFALQKRGKRHDYFTSCLPWPQKGAAVTLPLGTSAAITGAGDVWGASGAATGATNNAAPIAAIWAGAARYGILGANTVNATTAMTPNGGLTAAATATLTNQEIAYANKTLSQAARAAATAPFKVDTSTLTADLTTASAATINQLRLAFMTQSLLELDARGGTRYVEILRSHFGVISPDFRLQRAEYLGGGEIRITSHPVAQTAPTSGTNAQGQLAGMGTAVATSQNGIGFSKSFVEHGYVIGLACPRADLTYQQGLDRMWVKSTRYDFFWPKLQELGEQAVLNQEIYCDPAGGTDNNVFGYQERYAEYRYKNSQIKGAFRSTYSTPLDVWHLAENFSALPVLNASFITQNTPTSRIKAVVTEPDLIVDMFFNVTSARPMLTYSVPATLGRF